MSRFERNLPAAGSSRNNRGRRVAALVEAELDIDAPLYEDDVVVDPIRDALRLVHGLHESESEQALPGPHFAAS